MEKKLQKVQIIREIRDEDKVIKEAIEIAERFKVLPYGQINAILETKLGDPVINIQ